MPKKLPARDTTLEDLADLLADALPAPLPDYDPAVELTVTDFMRKTKRGNSSARVWLESRVEAGEWSKREVKMSKWRVTAYRPVSKV